MDELLPESIIFKYQLRMELLMLENVSWWKRFSEFQKISVKELGIWFKNWKLRKLLLLLLSNWNDLIVNPLHLQIHFIRKSSSIHLHYEYIFLFLLNRKIRFKCKFTAILPFNVWMNIVWTRSVQCLYFSVNSNQIVETRKVFSKWYHGWWNVK